MFESLHRLGANLKGISGSNPPMFEGQGVTYMGNLGLHLRRTELISRFKMSPFTILKIRKLFREHNITLALAVSIGLVGYSASGAVREAFAWTGLWTPLLWLLSLFAVGFLAKQEKKLGLDPRRTRLITLSLLISALIFSVCLWRYRVYWEGRIPPPPPSQEAAHEKFGPRR